MSPIRGQEVIVQFLDGSVGVARAEGTDAAWLCRCGNEVPLIGRCWGNPPPATECRCGKHYRVHGSDENTNIASRVEEI